MMTFALKSSLFRKEAIKYMDKRIQFMNGKDNKIFFFLKK